MSSLQSLKSRLDRLRMQEEMAGGPDLTDNEHSAVLTQNTTDNTAGQQTFPTANIDTARKIIIPVSLRTHLEELETGLGGAEQWLDALQRLADCLPVTDKSQRLITLSHYFGKALKCIPVSEEKTAAFGHLHVRYALLRGNFSESDARRAFSSARNAARKFAFVHVAAAQFELDHGSIQKARQILVRAKGRGAEPLEKITDALSNLVAGRALDDPCPSEGSGNTQNMENMLTGPLVDTKEHLSGVFHDLNTPVVKANRSPLNSSDERVNKRVRSLYTDVIKTSSSERHSSSGSSQSDDSLKLAEVSLPSSSRGSAMRLPRAPLSTLVTDTPRVTAEEPGAPSTQSKPRALRSCHSTPDCKQASLLSMSSSSKYSSKKLPSKAMRIPLRMQKWDEELDEPTAPPAPEQAEKMHVDTPALDQPPSSAAVISDPLLEPINPQVPSAQEKNTPEKDQSPHLDISASLSALNAAHNHQTQLPPAAIPAATPQEAPSLISAFMQKMTMLRVNGKEYLALKQIGRGGSSKVYLVMSADQHEYAVKCVDLNNADELTAQSYINEINLLQRLQYSNHIIKMHDFEYNESEGILYVVMEKGVRDLMTELRLCRKQGQMNWSMVKLNWHQMLLAVQVLHKEGIVHSDLKPANFVRSVGLTLIDFGIAHAIQQDRTSVTREQQIGSLNYMSPEAIIDVSGGGLGDLGEEAKKPKFKIGVKSDVWSLGCILYNMAYNRTPFQDVANSLKLHAIISPSCKIKFPPLEDPHLLDTMQRCLQRDPKLRPSIDELLKHPYLSGIN
ncbi:hypothetical protein CAPTEDRAFT_220365 [Capitella teleta]|uniref:Protein kinase domain-containing protein n=1 Tax=Capitella teleta TaxID=283909 RepID=R7T8L8_CAPTE|nr:hypothetical protein CAPTEDRAFT_220365 [Capitella teleta]|eukprot:ELT89748.1 hypothetical protein CAPTEDRAFT_220365 [Capitella teleta]